MDQNGMRPFFCTLPSYIGGNNATLVSGMDNGNNRSVLYNSYYILLYIDYLLFFFYSKYHLFCQLLLLYGWVGICFGTIFVKQWEDDEYMYRCDNLFFLPYPIYQPYALVKPYPVTRVRTHCSLLRSCLPGVFLSVN
jgi:hypothetical protein